MTGCSHNKRLIFVMLLITLAGYAHAAPPRINIDVRVDKSDITVGDLILFTVSARHDPAVKVNIPPIGDKLGEFLIRDIRTPSPKRENNMIVEEVTYQLTTYFTGEVTVPAITIEYTYTGDNGKEVRETVDTEPFKIQVNRVAPEDAADIRDIKGPVEVPVDWRFWAFWGGAALAVIAAIVLGVLYWTRWRPRARKRALTPPPLPAHEAAIEKFDRIEEMDLIAQGRFKQYYDMVTEALRAYIGARYTIEALEMTTSELLRGLQPSLKDLEIREKIALVLQDGDLVKFARHTPEKDRAREALEDARAVVTRTIPAMFLRAENDSRVTARRAPTQEA